MESISESEQSVTTVDLINKFSNKWDKTKEILEKVTQIEDVSLLANYVHVIAKINKCQG